MIKVHRQSADGLRLFAQWLEANEAGTPPAELAEASGLVEPSYDLEIDDKMQFASRHDLGRYLVETFHAQDFTELLAPENDGLWSWLTVIYFTQIAPGKHKRPEHYLVTRKGAAGSLAYRHAVRTSFELTYIHGDMAKICLAGPMARWGEMSEQLASRQTLAHNKAFFGTAHSLYIADGKLLRGAGTKPKKPAQRKPGDRAGLGGARRLALALQRLDLTFDTEVMTAGQLVERLPKEFSRWQSEA